MNQYDKTNELSMPFFGLFYKLDFVEQKNIGFDTGTLSWSLERLFGHYYRIISALSLPINARIFLESDIESFIIRFRVALNDISYLVWQVLPLNARGIKEPKGNRHPKNREMSISELVTCLAKNKTTYSELETVFSKASKWINESKNNRENIFHYKTRVFVFGTEPVSFTFFDAARTIPKHISTPEVGEKLVLQPVFEFVNDQMRLLINFMNIELANAIKDYVFRIDNITLQIDSKSFIKYIGIESFKSLNGIKE